MIGVVIVDARYSAEAGMTDVGRQTPRGQEKRKAWQRDGRQELSESIEDVR